MLVDDSTVLQHQTDRAADLSGIDVLLHEPVDARQASGREARWRDRPARPRLSLGRQTPRRDAEQRERQKRSALHGDACVHVGRTREMWEWRPIAADNDTSTFVRALALLDITRI